MNPQSTILVIDDEPMIREALQAILAVGNFKTVCAASGKEGLEKARSLRPDTILLDVMMPGMDGFEVCHALRADPATAHVPVILLTALSDKEHVARGLDAGADEFMTKPVSGLELRARVRSMLRIKRQHDELTAMLRLREDLVHMLVHDMRTPLTVIKFCGMALEPPEGADPQLHEEYEDLVAATERLHRLIDDMLLTARMDAGHMLVDRDETDVHALVSQVLDAQRRTAAEVKVTLVSDIPSQPMRVNVDAEIMVRVLDNLVAHAVKCSPKGSEVVVRASQEENGRTRFYVCDSGNGIPEEHRERIFQKFEVAELKRRGVRQAGIGLHFCKLAVEAHGGSIRVEPNVPKGSIFIVDLTTTA